MHELEDCLAQVHRMALAAMQSYTFWFYTRPDESPYESVLKKYGHFFYATHEAHLTMMFVSLDCLYDTNSKCINFQKLLILSEPELSAAEYGPIKKRIEDQQRKAKGVGILRSNCFAHITDYEKRVKLGEKYGLSQGEFCSLCYNSLDISITVARLLGATMPDATEINSKDLEQIQTLFSKLEENSSL